MFRLGRTHGGAHGARSSSTKCREGCRLAWRGFTEVGEHFLCCTNSQTGFTEVSTECFCAGRTLLGLHEHFPSWTNTRSKLMEMSTEGFCAGRRCFGLDEHTEGCHRASSSPTNAFFILKSNPRGYSSAVTERTEGVHGGSWCWANTFHLGRTHGGASRSEVVPHEPLNRVRRASLCSVNAVFDLQSNPSAWTECTEMSTEGFRAG